ncbi:hypothetical protein Scep_019237 [Stephania cephalantha]|uniref:Uncharacterized protein n=1 Tax=Stephania cephalantha TaxID=152367 RepID=A0AAP0IAG8_9MAGN
MPLIERHQYHELLGSRVETRNTHGTSYTLASFIADGLAKGLSVGFDGSKLLMYAISDSRMNKKGQLGLWFCTGQDATWVAQGCCLFMIRKLSDDTVGRGERNMWHALAKKYRVTCANFWETVLTRIPWKN